MRLASRETDRPKALLRLTNGALAMMMTVWIAEGHTILAALMAFLGIVIGVKALAVKPAMDRAAICDPNR